MTHRTDRCLNCDAPTPGAYCAACGQRNAEYRASFRELLADAADAVFQLDGRLARTLPPFVFAPGRLIRDYNAGRRARYTSPLRMYLFFSVACFAVVSMVSKRAVEESENGRPAAVKAVASGEVRGGDPPQDRDAPMEAQVPDLRAAQIHIGGGRIETYLQQRLDNIKKLSPREASRKAIDGVLDSLPRVLFVLLPLFALLLKLLYIRRRVFYVEHLVFALYTHAFLSFVLLVRAALWQQNLLLVVPPIHLFAAQYTVYGQPLERTLLKYALLCTVYLVLLSLGALAAVLLAVALL